MIYTMSVSVVTVAVVIGTGGHGHHLSPFSQWKQRQLGHEKESKMKAMARVTGTLQSLFQQAKIAQCCAKLSSGLCHRILA